MCASGEGSDETALVSSERSPIAYALSIKLRQLAQVNIVSLLLLKKIRNLHLIMGLIIYTISKDPDEAGHTHRLTVCTYKPWK